MPIEQIPLTGKVKNDGKASVTIPAGIEVGTASAFYLTAQCGEDFDTAGWSKGWFTLTGHVKESLVPPSSNFQNGGYLISKRRTMAVEPQKDEPLVAPIGKVDPESSTCSASLTYSVSCRAGLESASILGFTFAGNAFLSFTLMNPATQCVSP